MKNKSVLALVLALAMCISFALVGCGGETPTIIGDDNIVKVEGEYAFTVDGWDHGDKISYKSGANSSYSYSPKDYIAYIELEFENLSTDTIKRNDAFGGESMNGELVIDGTSYVVDTYLPEDIVSLGKGQVFICYTVPKEIIEGNGEKVATFTIGDILYQYNMVEGGNDAVEQPEEAPEGVTIEKAASAKEIKKGDVIKEDGVYECTVKGVDSGSKISDVSGSITHSYSPSDYAIWIELDFKNLSADTLESFDCDLINDVELVYDGKYNYTGGVWFANDIPALESSNVFIYFEAPKDAYTGEGSKVATFKIGESEFVYNF